MTNKVAQIQLIDGGKAMESKALSAVPVNGNPLSCHVERIPDDVISELRFINLTINRTVKTTIELAIRGGKILNDWKSRVDRGRWMESLADVGISQDTANRWMAVARKEEQCRQIVADNECVALTAIYAYAQANKQTQRMVECYQGNGFRLTVSFVREMKRTKGKSAPCRFGKTKSPPSTSSESSQTSASDTQKPNSSEEFHSPEVVVRQQENETKQGNEGSSEPPAVPVSLDSLPFPPDTLLKLPITRVQMTRIGKLRQSPTEPIPSVIDRALSALEATMFPEKHAA